MKSKVGNRIDFENDILKNENKIKGEPKVHYILRKYKNKGSYDILTDISGHVTLVKSMDYLGNLNRAISVVGYCIFDSNYKRELVLNRELLDMILPRLLARKTWLSLKKNYDVIYIFSTAHLKR